MYYKVMVPSGHCGAYHSDNLVFYLEASSMMAAVSVARKFPAVKHHSMAINAELVTKDEYDANIGVSAYARRNHTI